MTTINLDTDTTTAIGQAIVRPVYLIYIDLATPIRWSTSATVSWENETWSHADITLSGVGGSSPTIEVFNDGNALGVTLWEGEAVGTEIDIYQMYKFPSYTTETNPGRPAGYTPPVMKYCGAVGDIRISENVTIRCSQFGAKRLVTLRALDADFGYLPKPGERIVTDKQDIILV